MTAMPFSKTFETCTLAQSHVAAEKHCSAFNRAEAHAKNQQSGLFMGLLQTDLFLFVALHVQATYQLSSIAKNLKGAKGNPGWAAACPYAQERASFEPLHKEHHKPAA